MSTERLSRVEDPAHAYDAVVVGSGYGGSVLALRLAESGRSVALLERGREFVNGDFPNSLSEVGHELQVRGRRFGLGSPAALFDVRAGRDISVLVGCGLGGTSLINANVALRPDDSLFESHFWPAALREDMDSFQADYTTAGNELGPTSGVGALGRPRTFETAATSIRAEKVATPLLVQLHDGDGPGPEGSCTYCGNCISGCQIGAKKTVTSSYLTQAVAGKGTTATKAEIFTLVQAHAVLPGRRRRWRVIARATDHPEHGITVEADIVVLAAGTLGSTEILLRSARAGLPLSRRVGSRFSGNGDFLGVAYDAKNDLQGMGVGGTSTDVRVGPTITSTLQGVDDNGMPFIIQDGSVPYALTRLMPLALFVSALAMGERQPGYVWRHALSQLRDVARGPYDGATNRSLIMLMSSRDDHDGVLHLYDDRLTTAWPGVAERPAVKLQSRMMRDVAFGLGATYIPNPTWGGPLRKALITTHPLGGCVMGDDAAHGVVDHLGRVFRGSVGREVHTGLYVADGAIVPEPLGVNPSLTITALAERIARGITSNGAEPSSSPPADLLRHPNRSLPEPSGTAAIKLSWDERLDGFVSPNGGRDPDLGFSCGTREDSGIVVDVHVTIPDLDAIHWDPERPCAIGGTVAIPCLGGADAATLRVERGVFTLFHSDPDRVDRWAMRYEMDLRSSDEKRRYRFEGIKPLHDDPGWDMWPDLTTLRIVVTDELGDPVCSGRARIGGRGVANMVASMHVEDVGRLEGLRRRAAFVRSFLGHVDEVYGKALATGIEFTKMKAPVGDRPLALPPPDSYWYVEGHRWVEGARPDDAYCTLALTRYCRGASGKGPVILAPGLAMAARSFLGPTKQNITEFLDAAGYDVWLLDYRASIDLPSRLGSYTLDDVAREDWPTAVAKVRAVTGADDVQIVGHCMGSMTAQMAVLAGMVGVRSMVCSQVTVHPQMTAFSRFKARARISSILQGTGARFIDPPDDLDPATGLLDLLYRLNPARKGERCGSPKCRWVFAYFGPTHHHDRLDRDTHHWIGGEFGSAGLDALDHIARIVRKGHAVDANGEDVYNHPQRLALPIRFLIGEKNKIFLPEGARKTCAWLRHANSADLYDMALIRGYSHFDCFAGRNAHIDVFPVILRHLEAHPPA